MSSTQPGEPAIRTFAGSRAGVHAISRAQATEIVQAQLRSTAAPQEPPPIVWVDVTNPGEAEAAYLRDELGLHPLAVEDCIRGRQRPKLDRYPQYLFIVIYAAAVNPQRDRMALKELHIFVAERFIATVHDDRIEEIGEVIARWRSTPEKLDDVGSLAHRLLDAVVDDYFPVLAHFAERTERLEGVLFGASSAEDVSSIMMLRHELVLFRKAVAPQREVLSNILRRDLPFLRPELLPYFQDVHDHTIRVTEEIDSMRELLSALLDAQMTFSANQLNKTMRMLTAWSIILMSMALVAGIYGMNFAVMPELQWRWGYAFALLLMAAIGSMLVVFFHRRQWL